MEAVGSVAPIDLEGHAAAGLEELVDLAVLVVATVSVTLVGLAVIVAAVLVEPVDRAVVLVWDERFHLVVFVYAKIAIFVLYSNMEVVTHHHQNI